MAEFNIIYNDKMSLNELLFLKDKGASFVRSAHIGNWNKQTLILNQLNFPIVLHEFLKGNANLYEPSYVKFNNQKIKISNEDDSILQLYDNSFIFKDVYGFFKPSIFHYESLKKLNGENIEPISEYFLKYSSFVEKILKLLVSNFPCELNKYVDENGMVFYFKEIYNGLFQYNYNDEVVSFSEQEIVEQIFKLLLSSDLCLNSKKNINPSGIIMSSKFYLLLTCLCEIVKSNSTVGIVDLYHFSGTQMINYLIKNKHMSLENRMFYEEAYNLIYNSFPNFFPKTVNINLIPTDVLKYVGCLESCDCNYIEDIYKLYKEIEYLKLIETKITNNCIISKYNKLFILSDDELKQLFNTYCFCLSKKKYMKLKNMILNSNINNEFVSELANIIVKNDDTFNKIICSLEEIKKEKQKEMDKKIEANINLFSDDFTQYDLLLNNDSIYVAHECYNMPFHEIKDFSKLIISKLQFKSQYINKSKVIQKNI